MLLIRNLKWEKAMATHSSVLAWRIPGTGEPWWVAVYGVTQSRTRLKWLSSRPLWSSSLFLPEMLLNPPLSGLATRQYTFSWTTSMTTGGKDGERFYFRRMCKARGSVPVTRGIWLKILKSFHYPPKWQEQSSASGGKSYRSVVGESTLENGSLWNECP